MSSCQGIYTTQNYVCKIEINKWKYNYFKCNITNVSESDDIGTAQRHNAFHFVREGDNISFYNRALQWQFTLQILSPG